MIYLDNNATTRLDPRVLEAMLPFLTDVYANAASTHPFGVVASNAVKKARGQIADLIKCDSNEIVFTSGSTESINLAIKGVAASYIHKGKHIITAQTEHRAVLDTCKHLEETGFEVTYLPVQNDGLIDLALLKEALRPDTILVSIMLVNNEIGVIQPLKEIAEEVHAAGALLMTDATQAVGKMHFSVNDLGIDLMAFSAHKFYGPKGIGALYIKRKSRNKITIPSLMHGGGHEQGLRSGTLNVPGIIGLGQAAEICKKEMLKDQKRIGNIRDQLETALLSIPNTKINGNKSNRLYNITNIMIEDCDSDAMIMGLSDITVSNGSACTAALIEPSHVLLAIGLSEKSAFSSLRFSLGRFNTEAELPVIIKKISENVKELREMVNK